MVRQVLIKVGQAARVCGELMVLLAETVTGCNLSEPLQIDDIEGTKIFVNISQKLIYYAPSALT